MAEPANIVIRRAHWSELAGYHGEGTARHISYAEVALIDGAIVATGGFGKKDNRYWAFLDVSESARSCGLAIIRRMRKRLAQLGRPVYIQCAGHSAERLLRALGFTPTDETLTDLRDGVTQLRVFARWPNSPRS